MFAEASQVEKLTHRYIHTCLQDWGVKQFTASLAVSRCWQEYHLLV